MSGAHVSRSAAAAVLALVLVSCPAYGHLCNDVFAQAQDNLAVKVDIRDGQLRIGDQASFRVYLLNTMDRNIEEIRLRVKSNEFAARVEPSPNWTRFPVLRTAKRGGQKQYFTVTLRRKPGVPDGAYKIGLELYSERQNRAFKTVSLDEAAGLLRLPTTKQVKVDGKAWREEWGGEYVCVVQGMHLYERQGRYFENRPARAPTRFRLSCDEEYLYCLLVLEGVGDAGRDVGTIYAAPTTEEEPASFHLDAVSGKYECDRGTEGIEVKDCGSVPDRPDKRMYECKIPRALLGVEGAKTFYLNFTRTTGAGRSERVAFWRGNPISVRTPVAYGQFAIDD